MARYKQTDAADGQGLFLSVNLKEQLIPGTFPQMLDEVIDTKIDLSNFDKKYKNDKTGAPAVPPAALMKLIIYGYSNEYKSSRDICELSKNNIIAKALTKDIEPHWTTIADFISSNHEGFKKTFTEVLAYCNELGLVSGETFAVDGLRLPSNASLEFTGTKEELGKRLEIYKRMAAKHVERHARKDAAGEVDAETERHFKERQNKLERGIEKISAFLEETDAKKGNRGQEIKSNVTDNESALIHTSKGYIQGYIGMAVSDAENQVIVAAEAVGSANENEHFPDIIKETKKNMDELTRGNGEMHEQPVILADNNYWGESNLKAAAEAGMEMIMPDSNYKKRLGKKEDRKYEARDFIYHKEGDYYECPHGAKLEYKNTRNLRGTEFKVYGAFIKDCRACPCYDKCMKSKKGKNKISIGRRLMISASSEEGSLCNEMKKKMDTEEYQDKYTQRIRIIEPVFANISYCKGLNRFTLRGKDKVNGQWLLFCIVNNLGKCLNAYNKVNEYE